MPVKDDRRLPLPRLGSGRGDEDRQPVVLLLGHLDIAGLQPALHEGAAAVSCSGLDVSYVISRSASAHSSTPTG